MENLQAVAGAGHTVKVGDREWRLSQLRVGDYAELAEKVASLRPDPLEYLRKHAKDLPESVVTRLAEEAWKDVRKRWMTSLEEIDEWTQTPEGQQYRVYLMLRRQHPDVTLDQAAEVIDAWKAEAYRLFAEKLEQLDGLSRTEPGN